MVNARTLRLARITEVSITANPSRSGWGFFFVQILALPQKFTAGSDFAMHLKQTKSLSPSRKENLKRYAIQIIDPEWYRGKRETAVGTSPGAQTRESKATGQGQPRNDPDHS